MTAIRWTGVWSWRILRAVGPASVLLLQGPCALTSEEVRTVASNSFQSFINGLFSNVVKDLVSAAFGLN